MKSKFSLVGKAVGEDGRRIEVLVSQNDDIGGTFLFANVGSAAVECKLNLAFPDDVSIDGTGSVPCPDGTAGRFSARVFFRREALGDKVEWIAQMRGNFATDKSVETITLNLDEKRTRRRVARAK